MNFKSLAIAFKIYLDYDYHSGFSVRENLITRSRKDKLIIGQEFVCSEEGLKEE